MNALGIQTGRDLRRQSRAFLSVHFGKAADYYYGVARGQDDRPVEADQPRKSVGAETTFAQDLKRWEEVEPVLQPVFAKIWDTCSRGGHAGRTVTVKVKYADFQQITRSRSGLRPIGSEEELARLGLDLLRPCFPPRRGIRLLGVTISSLEAREHPPQAQLALLLDLAPRDGGG
jgi:DNA polymerase-4